MAKVNKVFPSPYNGMSEQIPEMMLDNQCVDMVNCIPDLITGLSKRPPALWRTRVPGLSDGFGDEGTVTVTADGWYSVTYNTDTFGDYDVDTLTYQGGYWFGTNPSTHTVDANLNLQTQGWRIESEIKTRVNDTATLWADRNFSDVTDNTYRCQLSWDKITRTWNRTDAEDYYIWPPNHSGKYAWSLGVITSDPRFLATLTDQSAYNLHGLYPDFPKTALIWLFKDESI